MGCQVPLRVPFPKERSPVWVGRPALAETFDFKKNFTFFLGGFTNIGLPSSSGYYTSKTRMSSSPALSATVSDVDDEEFEILG